MQKRRMTLQEVIDLKPCWLQEDREAGIERIRRLFGRCKYATPQRIMAADIGSGDKLWLLLREPFFTRRQLALIACDFAEEVLPIYEAEFPGDTRPREAIDTARRHARGGVGSDEMRAAGTAAWAAGAAAEAAEAVGIAAWAAWAAARAAAGAAAWAAAEAAGTAAWAARARQVQLLEKYL